MKSSDIKKLYSVHSWVGLVTGILMFVIAFTGAVSVFGRDELKIWSNPEIRSDINLDAQRVENVVQELSKQVPDAYKEEVIIYVPRARTTNHLTVLFEQHTAEEGQKPRGALFTLDNHTYEVTEKTEGTLEALFANHEHDMADFIIDFHADLHMGRPIGLLLTGLLGLTLMLSVVTGFIIHRQKIAQLFTFRPKKKLDISLADAHKLFGVWGMIFHAVIGFSGAFLGLATVILIPAAAFVSFGGDQEKLIETFTTTPEPELAQIYAPTQVASIFEHAMTYQEGAQVSHFVIMGFNDQNAVVYANAIGGPQVARQMMVYSGNDGKFVEAFGQFGKLEGVSGVILDLMFPLHFGNFGGVPVKILWAILGLSTALLPLSGLMLWIERGTRAKSPHHSPKTYQRFNRLVIGSCGGIVLACVALFPTQLILLKTIPGEDFFTPIAYMFFSVWALATLWPFVLRKDGLAASSLFYAIGGLLLVTPLLNAILTDDNLFTMAVAGQWEAFFTDLTLLVLGVLTCYSVKKATDKKAATAMPAIPLTEAKES